MSPLVRIRHFTDPQCPFAFSAEPRRLRLLWLYGEQLAWDTRMVVLREERAGEWPFAEAHRRLALEHGMPIDWRPRPWLAASVHACRAVVAARLRWPDRADALLRRLRVLNMAGELLDDSDTLDRAAAEAGIPVAEIAAYCAEPEAEAALREDMALARDPSSAARALDHKLGGPGDARRYSCPSLELSGPDGRRIDLPGFQPPEAYEAAVANLAPDAERRPAPEGPEAVLAWAGMPLATAEVAMVMGADAPDVRAALARTARLEPAGADGYWSLGD